MSIPPPPQAPVAHAGDAPSVWVLRFMPLIKHGGSVLDLAAGHGRHARILARAGLMVEAVDRHPAALEVLRGIDGVHAHAADLESGNWPYASRRFDAVLVTNYLWRPLFPALVGALAAGGVLIYETFGIGNERFGKPSNPEFLLRPGELLEVARQSGLGVLAFESGLVSHPRAAIVERICARRQDHEAPPPRLDAAVDPDTF